MKKTTILTLFLLLIPTVLADEWNYNSKNLVVELNISSEATIKRISSDYSIQYIIVNLSFFPKDTFNQDVLYLDVAPEAVIEDDIIQFKWEDVTEDEVGFKLSTNIKTKNKIKEIKNKVLFPIQDLQSELIIYTKPSKTIDSDNEEIIKMASSIAEGEDDLFIVVSKIGEWTKSNVKYDLSTLTADVAQKASWVLKNKEGVCDEITNLFIAMLRALSIPAKFVSGVAYTNSPLSPTEWGPHGWAEVYFPGYGWIPFDVTYGEFGFIDPTHLELKESLDADTPSTQYQWLGRNIDVDTKKLDMNTRLKNKIGDMDDLVSITVIPIKKAVGFGSYNLIEVTIKNLKDFYVSTELYFSTSEEVDIISDKIKQVTLTPEGEKKVYWIIKLTDKLDRGFIYTLPIAISSLRNVTAETSFKSTYSESKYSLTKMQEILKQKQEEEEKIYSKSVDLECNINKKEFYVYEDGLIECTIKNIGNIFLEDVNVCLEEDCLTYDLGIMQEKKMDFKVNSSFIGKQELIVSANNNQISKTDSIEFSLLDEPKLEITDLDYPENISFKDQYQISFMVNKISTSNPKNIVVNLKNKKFRREWSIDELSDDKGFIINLYGNNLNVKENNFNIFVEYEDKNKRKHTSEKDFSVNLVDVTFFQRIIIITRNIGEFLKGFF